VEEIPIITPLRHVVNTQPIVTNPFGSLFSSFGYNTQSILLASIPFSYGISNFTSQFSSSIPASNSNPSIGLGGMAPLHIPLSFGGVHIPQKNPTVGSLPPFHPRSNPSLNAHGWSNQPGEQAIDYVPSFTSTSSTLILTNTFGMTNPLYPLDLHLREVIFILWETPNLELLRLGEIFTTLIITFLLE
jgi:hypothetical protein